MSSKLYKYIAAILVIVTACKKEEGTSGQVVNDQAYISFTNVSPSVKPLNLFLDGKMVNTNGAVTTNNTLLGTYFGAAPGSKTISIRDTSTAATIEYANSSLSLEGGKSYSAFVYDTLTGGKMKVLVLNTDRTPVPYGKAGVRFLNFIPNPMSVDLWLFKTVSGVTDSLKLSSAVPYVGTNPNASSLSAFTQVPAAQYTARLRTAGTNTNLASATISLVDTRVYTVVARGLVGGSGSAAIGLATVAH